MKQTWIHIVLYIGCMTLLLLQGYRIQELQREQTEHHAAEMVVRQMLSESQKSLILSNERCGWNKRAENTYGYPHALIKEQ